MLAKGTRHRQLRCLLSGTCDDTDLIARALLPRSPRASWSLPRGFGIGALSAVPRCFREALLSPAARRVQQADPGRESRTIGALGMNLEGGGSRGGEFGMSSVSCGNGKLRQWLIDQIDSGKYPGLVWENEEKSIFRIPWKHAGKQDYNREEDAALFKVTRTWGARGRDGGGPQRADGSEPGLLGEPSPCGVRPGPGPRFKEGRVTHRDPRDGVVAGGRAAREQQVWMGQSPGRREVSASLVISQTGGPVPF